MAERWWIGICFTVCSNVLISLALNCQKLAHKRLDESYTPTRGRERGGEEHTPLLSTETRPSYLRSQLWWLGFGLMSLGETGNFLCTYSCYLYAAYGFAPASLVSPLGAVSLLSNVIIAPALLHEPMTHSDLLGIVLAILGAVAVVSSIGPSGSEPMDPPALWSALACPTFVVYALLMLALGIGLMMACHTSIGRRSILVHVGVCGVFGGFTVLATKGVSSFVVHAHDARILHEPLFYVLLAVLVSTALLQLAYLNGALQRFDSRHVVPTQFVLFTVSTIVGSSILYHDFAKLRWPAITGFSLGCTCTFIGVFVLTWDFGPRPTESPVPTTPHIVVEEPSTSPSPAQLGEPMPVPEIPRRRSMADLMERSRSSLVDVAHVLVGTSARSITEPAQSTKPTHRRTRSRPDLHPHVLNEALGYTRDSDVLHDAQPTFLGLSPGRNLLIRRKDLAN